MKNAGAMSTREPRRRGRGRAGAGQRAYEAFLNGSAHSCEQAPRHADLSLALPFDDDGGDDEDHRCGCAAVMPQPVLDADVFGLFGLCSLCRAFNLTLEVCTGQAPERAAASQRAQPLSAPHVAPRGAAAAPGERVAARRRRDAAKDDGAPLSIVHVGVREVHDFVPPPPPPREARGSGSPDARACVVTTGGAPLKKYEIV